MLLVAVSTSTDKDAIAQAAAASGLSVADIRYRLQGTLPRVLMSDADGERLAAIGERLEPLGFTMLSCDPRAAPTDGERVMAQTMRWQADGFVAIDGAGREHECAFAAVEAIQRAVRVTAHITKEKTTERKFDVTRAVLSSGLILTRKEEKEVVRKTEASEPFVLLERNDGEPDIALYERRMNYRFLGPDMQPVSRANLEAVVRRLRAAAPGAMYDDRVARPGFISGLPTTSVDPVDLGLYLVALARRRGGFGARASI
jgi:hypothetical protein